MTAYCKVVSTDSSVFMCGYGAAVLVRDKIIASISFNSRMDFFTWIIRFNLYSKDSRFLRMSPFLMRLTAAFNPSISFAFMYSGGRSSGNSKRKRYCLVLIGSGVFTKASPNRSDKKRTVRSAVLRLLCIISAISSYVRPIIGRHSNWIRSSNSENLR